jgi:hypothetical protein
MVDVTRLKATLALMIAALKPRGFLDYGLFALMLTGMLMVIFSYETSGGIGWADAALALAAAVFGILAIILVRRKEKAAWIARPTWQIGLLLSLGASSFIVGAICADSYLLHRRSLAA